eukprot:284100_1
MDDSLILVAQACNYDANDCELGCVNECTYLYQVLPYFGMVIGYDVHLQLRVAALWPKAIELIGGFQFGTNTEYHLKHRDSNNDKHINFRQFDGSHRHQKAIQLN